MIWLWPQKKKILEQKIEGWSLEEEMELALGERGRKRELYIPL